MLHETSSLSLSSHSPSSTPSLSSSNAIINIIDASFNWPLCAVQVLFSRRYSAPLVSDKRTHTACNKSVCFLPLADSAHTRCSLLPLQQPAHSSQARRVRRARPSTDPFIQSTHRGSGELPLNHPRLSPFSHRLHRGECTTLRLSSLRTVRALASSRHGHTSSIILKANSRFVE